MDNWDIYTIVNYLINKSQSGNTFSPTEFEDVLNDASLRLFNRKIGMPEEYKMMQPLTQMGYADTTRMLIDLAPFIVSIEDGTFIFTNGIAEYPTNFCYPIAMKYKVRGGEDCLYSILNKQVELLNAGEYFMRTSSILRPINLDYPVYTISDKINIYPNTISNVDFTYLKYPNKAIIYTITNSLTGELEYNSSTSTELEWTELGKLEIISIILSNVGLNLRSGDIIGLAEKLKQTGI